MLVTLIKYYATVIYVVHMNCKMETDHVSVAVT